MNACPKSLVESLSGDRGWAQGWIGNKATHFAFYCNDPCCGPNAAHPETALCGVLFARMSVAG